MIGWHRLARTFLLLKLAGLGVNLVTFPRLNATMRGSFAGPVSLLVPARNEATTLAATLPGLLAQDADEVLLLDDCSTDGTAAAAHAIAGADPRFTVLTGRATPPGWTGKTWACHQLAEHATGTTLVFCDADVTLSPSALAAVAWQLDRQRADVLSVFPRQVTRTLGERLVVPVIDDVLLCFLPHPLLRAPVPSAATACGALVAFTRAGYDRLGGFASVRTELTEDVAIARRARRQGLQLGLALGGPLVSTRMYDGYRDAVVAFGRGVHGALGRRPARWALPALVGWQAVVYTLPVLLCRHRRWALLVVLGAVERLAVEAKTGRRQWAEALLGPLSPIALAPVALQAMRRRQQWKGRSYP